MSQEAHVLDNGNVTLNGNGNGSANGAIGLIPPAQAAPLAPALAPASDPTPETLIFRAGLLSPDQLGELVQERVSSGRSVEQIVVDRGWADAESVARALGLEPPAVEIVAPPIAIPAPLAVVPAPQAEIPAPQAEIPAPQAEIPAPQAEIPAPQAVTPVPQAVTPVPQAEIPAPQAETSAPPPPLAAAEPEPVPLHVVSFPITRVEVGQVATEAAEAVEVEFRVVLRFVGNDFVEIARFEGAAEAKGSAHAIALELGTASEQWPFLGGRYVRPEAVLSVDVDAVVR